MRAGSYRANARCRAEEFTKDLETDLYLTGTDDVGVPKDTSTRMWRRRFTAIKDMLGPALVMP